MRDFLLILSLLTVTIFTIYWCASQLLAMPVVYKSWNTGYCVRVESPDPNHNCENLPRKFHHEWVQ